MDNVINKEIDKWYRPWNISKFDDISIRDERFFSILLKGCLNWLNHNIFMYDKAINHFIFNTGSSYLYVEDNGYEFKWSETTGEDQMYMAMPRCVCEIGDFNIPTEELTNPFVRGIYERRSSKTNEYKGYNAEMRRIPLEVSMTLRYVLSNFNESIILVQELFEKMVFQQYFNIVYLGQQIQCSIEFPTQQQTNLNRIDFDSTEVNQKTIEIPIKIETYLPVINVSTEIENQYVIKNGKIQMNIMKSMENNRMAEQIGDYGIQTDSEEVEIGEKQTDFINTDSEEIEIEGNQVDFIINTNSEKNI